MAFRSIFTSVKAYRTQLKEIVRWVNGVLAPRKLEVRNVAEDFKDGVNLCNLLEVVSDSVLPKYNKRVSVRTQKQDNCDIAFEFMASSGLKLDFSADAIVKGEVFDTADLLQKIFLHYQFAKTVTAFDPQAKPAASTTKASAIRSVTTWVNCKLSSPVADLTGFGKGNCLCALVDALDPEAGLMKNHKASSLDGTKSAIVYAESKMGVPALLDAEDFMSDQEEFTYCMYLAQFMAYKNGASNGADHEAKARATKTEAKKPPPPPPYPKTPKPSSKWTRVKHLERQFFYWNEETDETTWNMPAGFVDSDAPPATPSSPTASSSTAASSAAVKSATIAATTARSEADAAKAKVDTEKKRSENTKALQRSALDKRSSMVWMKVMSDNGTPYFWNERTDQTTWDRPLEYEDPPSDDDLKKLADAVTAAESAFAGATADADATEAKAVVAESALAALKSGSSSSSSSKPPAKDPTKLEQMAAKAAMDERYAKLLAKAKSPWKAVKCDNGQSYYWNEKSDETTWEKPPDFVDVDDESEVAAVIKELREAEWEDLELAQANKEKQAKEDAEKTAQAKKDKETKAAEEKAAKEKEDARKAEEEAKAAVKPESKWTAVLDGSGTTYYWNEETDATTWDKPAELIKQEENELKEKNAKQQKEKEDAAVTRLPNCKLFPTSSSLWIGVIVGPKESSYRGGVFKVHLTLSPSNAFSAKFVPPIHHCNVNEKTGEIAFPKSMFGVAATEVLCAISDLLTTPAAASLQNDAAVQLFKTDRVKYDSLARKAASSFWLGALDDEMKLIPDILDLFLPHHVMSGAAQLEIFRQLALHEAETSSAAQASVHVHVQNLELEHFQEKVLAHRAAEAVTQLKGNLDEALLQLASYSYYGKPDFEAKMKSLEQEMTISYLQEHVVGSPVAHASSKVLVRPACRPSVKCMEEMIMEAKSENVKLSKLMTFCFKKYKALSARFTQLQGIEEQKADLAQSLDAKVPFFVAQAKYLEPDFRSILCGLVDQFNRNELPASINGQDSKEVFSELRLTSGKHAKVIFALQKSVQRLQEKMSEGQGKACEVFDYLRATIVMADPALLTVFYRALSLDTRFRIRRVKNKLSIDLDQPPNVHINLEFRGHIGEVQLILEDFFLIKEHSHKPYELTRIGFVRGDLVQGAELGKVVESVVSNGVYLLHPGKVEH